GALGGADEADRQLLAHVDALLHDLLRARRVAHGRRDLGRLLACGQEGEDHAWGVGPRQAGDRDRRGAVRRHGSRSTRCGEERRRDKREFLAACEDFAQVDGHLLRSFSLIGTRGDCDLMLLSQSRNLDHVHEFHVLLAQSGLMKWSSVSHSYLAMTKPSEYSDESRLEVRPAHGRYLFVYPFVKTRAWYRLTAEER